MSFMITLCKNCHTKPLKLFGVASSLFTSQLSKTMIDFNDFDGTMNARLWLGLHETRIIAKTAHPRIWSRISFRSTTKILVLSKIYLGVNGRQFLNRLS